VIRRQFVVQLHGVRLVDGVPERGPASNNRVDVFRAGGSEKKNKTKNRSHRTTRERVAHTRVSCLLAGGGEEAAEGLLAGSGKRRDAPA
jgi:hypothetical protein